MRVRVRVGGERVWWRGSKEVRVDLIMAVMAHSTDIHAFSNTFDDPKSPALPSTLSLMANLLPITLISSPHMPTLPPLAHDYHDFRIDVCFVADQQLHDVLVSVSGCLHEPCVTPLHTKEASADDSVRACHVRMTVSGWWGVRVGGGESVRMGG